jgi:probable rRNA maturation factor
MGISFSNQSHKFTLTGKKKLIEWILLVCFLEKRVLEEINYIFCDDTFLLMLNKQYLKHTALTDIITFDYSTRKKINAEIYISIDRVRANAATYKVSLAEELRRVMIHGVLHCIGFTDKTNRTRAVMRRMENKYLLLYSEMS